MGEVQTNMVHVPTPAKASNTLMAASLGHIQKWNRHDTRYLHHTFPRCKCAQDGSAAGWHGAGNILDSAARLIGETPMIFYQPKNERLFGTIACKLEMFNGSKSVKDRIALSMVLKAEADGLIRPGETTLVEPTSGNTGIALAYVAAAKGYKLQLTMPASMSTERKLLLRGYGAQLVCTPPERGMLGAIRAAEDIVATTPHTYMLQQFENPANPDVHYASTGPEIWRDSGGAAAYLVAGVGTGGTISGAGRFLKERNPRLRVIAVEPTESAVISGGSAGMHGIPGIGAGFLPGTLDRAVLDGVIRVSTEEAMNTARIAARDHGLLVGVSSGAALAAAVRVAKRPEARNSLIVVILPSSGERYLSTAMFRDLWMSGERKDLYGA